MHDSLTEARELQTAVPSMLSGASLNGTPGRVVAGSGAGQIDTGKAEARVSDLFGALLRQQLGLGGKTAFLSAAGGVPAKNAESPAGAMGSVDSSDARAADAGAAVHERAREDAIASSPGAPGLAPNLRQESGENADAPRATESAIAIQGGARPVAVSAQTAEPVSGTTDKTPGAISGRSDGALNDAEYRSGPYAREMHPTAAETGAPMPVAATVGAEGKSSSGSDATSRLPSFVTPNFGLQDSGRAQAALIRGAVSHGVQNSKLSGHGVGEPAQKPAVAHHATAKPEDAAPPISCSGSTATSSGSEAAAGTVGATAGAVNRPIVAEEQVGKGRSISPLRMSSAGASGMDGGSRAEASAVGVEAKSNAAPERKAGAASASDGMPASVAAANERGENDGSAAPLRSGEATGERGAELRSVRPVAVHAESGSSAAAALTGTLTTMPAMAHGTPAATTAAAGTAAWSDRSSASVHPADLAGGAAFEQMDGAMAPRVIKSAPQRLAVGVRDGGLGWVEIRTNAAGGEVAAVIGTTAAAHPAMAAELPSMREFLAGQQVRVDHLAAEDFSALGRDGGGNASGGRGSGREDAGSQAGDAERGLRDDAGAVALFTDEGTGDALSYISVRV